jgi:hypothetical protein
MRVRYEMVILWPHGSACMSDNCCLKIAAHL